MGVLSSGLSNYMAKKKAASGGTSVPVKAPKNAVPSAPQKAPKKMASSKVGSNRPSSAMSSGKMASGTPVNLGTTVHKPGQGHDVAHPL